MTGPEMDPEVFAALRQRLGEAHLGRRMRLQAQQVAVRSVGGGPRWHWENFALMPVALYWILRLSGLLGWASRNALAFQVEQVDISIAGLPQAFDGYRIAQLSDLHVDAFSDGGQALRRVLDGLDFDLCVLTGDYRFRTRGDYVASIEGMARLMPSLDCPDGVVGILGNHDYVEMVPGLEHLGIRMLLNEALSISRAHSAPVDRRRG